MLCEVYKRLEIGLVGRHPSFIIDSLRERIKSASVDVSTH